MIRNIIILKVSLFGLFGDYGSARLVVLVFQSDRGEVLLELILFLALHVM